MDSWVRPLTCLPVCETPELLSSLSHCLLAPERPLHPKEKVLEQVLRWCKMADPGSSYLVVKSVPKGQGINILTCTCVQTSWTG